MSTLLPPNAVLPLISGASPAEAFAALARLDLSACRFGPKVDDCGAVLLAETNFSGFGHPASGALAFSANDVAALQRRGQSAILVNNGQNSEADTDGRGLVSDGHILVNQTADSGSSWYNEHFLTNAAYSKAVLLDNPAAPGLSLDAAHTSLRLKDGPSLHAGDVVTLDPIAGKLWRGQLPILPPPDYLSALEVALSNAFARVNGPRVAFHSTMHGDLHFIGGAPPQHTLAPVIGLYRTEENLRAALGLSKDGPTAALDTLANGVVPRALNLLNAQVFQNDPEMTFRLADLRSMADLMPPELAASVAQDGLHLLDSPAFRLRSYLYIHQLRAAFTSWGVHPFKRQKAKDIIIPDITNVGEVQRLKNLVSVIVRKYVPEDCRPLVHFGVMIETTEALKNIAEIAPLCDKLCFGTNDLTAALTGLSRAQLDHRDWMRARGYDGRSPFEVLVPEVTAPMAEAIKAARAANPDVRIAVCGYQVGGHDAPSQLAVLDMKVDEITIPPNLNSVLRTQATVIRHKAGFLPA